MKKLPEGARRVCVVTGVLLVIALVLFAAVSSGGFTKMVWQQWAIFVISVAILYWAPALIYRTYRWIREGFSVSN